MTPRPALEAVVFDAGGTLVRLDFEWMSEALGGLGLAVDPGTLRRAEVEGRRAYDRSRGNSVAPGELNPPLGSRGDTGAYLGGTLAAAGVPPHVAERAMRAFLDRQAGPGLWARPVEGAREALDSVLGLGLRVAVVSNSDGRAQQHLIESGVHEGLEFVVDSQHVGIEKPDPGIFRIALEKLGLEPHRALYVGDIRSVDEEGALAAGMHFVLIDPLGDYGAPGGAAIPSIGRLAGWIAEHFTVIPSSSPRARP